MKRVLVTGAAGFLGSHLVDSLLADDCFVYAMDNLSTGDIRNLYNAMDHEHFVWVKRDVRDSYTEIKVDEIYNFACPASPPKYQADPIGTFWTSITGVKNAIDCALNNHAKLIQASTSEVYGDPLVHPQPESYWGNVNPVSVRSCYDEGKRAAETMLHDYAQHRGLKAKIVRIFNTYGPRMSPTDGRVVSNFINQALSGEDITIYGDGSQTRSFTYYKDLIRGIRDFMDQTPDSFMGPMNIGNDTEFTVGELANLVIQLTDSSSKVVYNPLPKDDPCKRKPDLTLAKQMIGFGDLTPLQTGLNETIEYFKGLK